MSTDPNFAIVVVATASPEPDGAPLNIGDVLTLTLESNLSIDSVTPGTGGTTPTLALSNGATAAYTGYDSAGLHFSYTVEPGDSTSDLAVTGLSLNGTTVAHVFSRIFSSEPQQPLGMFAAPVALTTADFNGDGKLDILAADNRYVTLWLSTGSGGFQLWQPFPSVATPVRGAVTADLNHDGKADVVIAEDNVVSVWLGNGDGSFLEQQQSFPFVGLSVALTTADVSGDGKLDIVAADGNGISVWLGNGDGSFNPQQPFPLSGPPLAVTTADLNGDGRLDIVTTSGDSLHTDVSVWLNTGSGSFDLQQTLQTFLAPATLGDVNGDGKLDLLTTSGPDSVTVRLGTGDGSFAFHSFYELRGELIRSVTLADVDGDGALDMVTATNRGVSVGLNTGSGSFVLEERFVLQDDPSNFDMQLAVTTADIDGDGKPDIVAANDISILAWLNHPSTTTAYLDAASLSSASGLDTGLVVAPPTIGTDGDDSFVAPAGGSEFIGGRGVDSIAFDFALTDATITYSGDKVIIDGPSSHTLLSGLEIYKFTDGTVDNADGSPLVDDLYYYAHNHDVWNAHLDADAHYHTTGWREGRDPSALFSTSTYLSLYPDVRAAGVDPLAHFDQIGWREGRAPSIAFDPAAYLAANPDVRAAGIDPLAHFLGFGAAEGRQPTPFDHLLGPNGFDYVYYLQHNPDVAAVHVDPFAHYQTVGWHEGRNPNAYFDTAGYLTHYADVAAANVNPLDHYNQSGWQEGRDPSVNFDTTEYLAHDPDVAAAHINPLIQFLQFGQHEGRSTFADGTWG